MKVGERMLIDTDDDTCWVNDVSRMIGRFSRHGLEITFTDSVGDGVWYKAAPLGTTVKDWQLFQEQMKVIHKVWIPDEMKPLRITTPQPTAESQ